MTRQLAFALAAGAALSLSACQTGPRTRADLVADAGACADTRFNVYFSEGSARLTGQAEQLIETTAMGLRTCTIIRSRVIGLADSTGTPQANWTLSQRRAVAVSQALEKYGLPAPVFEIAVGGELGATTADGREDPVRRRAEVHLSVTP